MGNPAIGRKSDYWKLYAENPKIREGAQQRFGVRPEGSEGGGNVTSNPFETSGTSPINPATQVASGGNQNLQKKLANIGTGELTPTCDAKHQWFA